MKNWLDGWKMLCCLKVWFMAHVSVVHWKQIHLSRWKTSAFSFSRWSNFHQLHTITPTPRLDFQFRSHHLSRYHMPDFIFSVLNQKLLCQFWVIFYSKMIRFQLHACEVVSKHAFEDCFLKSFQLKRLNNKLKKKVLYANISSSFPFSLCCGNNFEVWESKRGAPVHLLSPLQRLQL